MKIPYFFGGKDWSSHFIYRLSSEYPAYYQRAYQNKFKECALVNLEEFLVPHRDIICSLLFILVVLRGRGIIFVMCAPLNYLNTTTKVEKMTCCVELALAINSPRSEEVTCTQALLVLAEQDHRISKQPSATSTEWTYRSTQILLYKLLLGYRVQEDYYFDDQLLPLTSLNLRETLGVEMIPQ